VYLAFFIWNGRVLLATQSEVAPPGETRKRIRLGQLWFLSFRSLLTRYDGWLLAAVVVRGLLVARWLGNFALLRPA